MPRTPLAIRLNADIERELTEQVQHHFCLGAFSGLTATMPRNLDWFQFTVHHGPSDYEMSWKVTSTGDVAFVTQMCISKTAQSGTRRYWSFYDLAAHIVFELRVAREMWRATNYYGDGVVAAHLSLPNASLTTHENSFPSLFYGNLLTTWPFSRDLLALSKDSQSSGTVRQEVDYSMLHTDASKVAAKLLT
jgi:hypothetical protein